MGCDGGGLSHSGSPGVHSRVELRCRQRGGVMACVHSPFCHLPSLASPDPLFPPELRPWGWDTPLWAHCHTSAQAAPLPRVSSAAWFTHGPSLPTTHPLQELSYRLGSAGPTCPQSSTSLGLT